MGQYYHPVDLDLREYAYSHNYDSGLKLMEHSWVGNTFVGVVMNLLKPGNRWFKHKIIWLGDYADEVTIDVLPDQKKAMAEGIEGGDNTLHQFIMNNGKQITDTKSMTDAEQRKAILINHTKKEYVMYSKLPEDDQGWTINPLPLLTAAGNGRGGGDYSGTNKEEVGIWAGDELSIEFEEPKGYKEIDVEFDE